MELDEHFYHLKVKYKAISYQNDQLLNPLYFILRKVDMNKALTKAEWQWLNNHNLLETIQVINNEMAFRSTLLEQIENEPNLIINDNNFSHFLTITKSGKYGISKSEILMDVALTVYRINANEALNHEEIVLINSQLGIYIDERAYKQYVEFKELNKKYALNDNLPFNKELYSILKKLEAPDQLSTDDIHFLVNHNLLGQFSKLQKDFKQLQNKYKAIKKGQEAEEIKLYPILKKLDENGVLSPNEFDWLKTQNYIETTTIARQIEFVALKKKFGADEIEEKTLPHHLYTILVKIDSNKVVSEADINYLKKRKLFKTINLALKLYSKFDIEPVLENQLCEILYKLEIGERLHDADVAWLTIKKWFHKGELSESMIYQHYHSLEAMFCEQEYKRTRGMWNLVNASSHWRKADDPQKALNNTEVLFSNSIKELKLNAALLTTRGGALRDIGKLDEAENCAHQAIEFYQKSYHPYTLLGAVCFQTGRYSEGQSWFEEARKFGAPENSEIDEILGILKNLKDKKERENLLAFLKDEYPSHFNKFKRAVT